MASDEREVVVVGRIQGPYGIRGWVHVASFTDPKANILIYRPWLVRAVDSEGWRVQAVEELRPHRDGFVARLGGIGDRSAAESMKGWWIGVPESELPAAAPDEFYWRDLIGLNVVDPTGQAVGTVIDLMETGANDVLVVRDARGAETLIPFHRRYVLEADLAAGRILVDWQAD